MALMKMRQAHFRQVPAYPAGYARQRHQTEGDENAADVLGAERAPPRKATRPKIREPGLWRDIEREDLNDQRGPDIGAKHDRKRRNETDQTFHREGTRDQGRRGATLQKGGQTNACGERGESISQVSRKKPSKPWAKGTQNSALDHVQAPE
jgi:hypothetical protein